MGNYAGLTFTGLPNSNGQAGFAVSGIGDVNGDGFEDIAVAAPDLDVTVDVSGTPTAYNNAGAVYVVFGTDQGFNTTIALDTLDGSDGFKITGEAGLMTAPYGYSYADFGSDVVGLGDVNGDGVDDFGIVQSGTQVNPYSYFGELTDPNARFDNGVVYVIYGGTAAPSAVESAGDMAGFRIDAVGQVTDVFNAGDVNGDGFNDVGFNTIERYDSTSASAYFSVDVIDDVNGNGVYDPGIDSYYSSYNFYYHRGSTQGFVVFGTDQARVSDTSIAPSGTNGGGTASTLLSGSATTNTIVNSEMLDGSDGFEVNTGSVATAIPYSYGSYGYVYIGQGRGGTGELISMGDFNGDGFSDLVSNQIDGANSSDGYNYQLMRQPDGYGGYTFTWGQYGDPNFGESTAGGYLIYGKDDTTTNFEAAIDRSTVDTTYTVSSLFAFGDDVMQDAGDVSGNDGFSDLLVADTFVDISAAGDGSQIVSGVFLINGTDQDPFTGGAGVTARSFSNADVIGGQGAFFYDSTVSTTFNRPGFEIGAGDRDRMYGGVGVGDITGDGIDDFVLAASVDNPSSSNTLDLLYIVPGSLMSYSGVIDLSTLAGVYKYVDPHTNTFEDFSDLQNAGDLNGDGFNDLIIGENSTLSFDGRATVIFGGPNFLEAMDRADGSNDNTLEFASLDAVIGTGVPTAGDDNLEGTMGDDTVILRAGDDVFSGKEGDDSINGGSGDDFLGGDAGDDIIVGGSGADTIAGGSNGATGDLLSYSNSDAGVSVDLGTGTGTGGHATGDMISGIENLFGSQFDDTLTGDGNDNILNGLSGDDMLDGGDGDDALFGGGGNDILISGLGADTLDGGGGTGDTADYSGSNAGVIIGTNAGAVNSGGHAAGDVIVASTENLTGSSFDDQITGNTLQNVLTGGDGNDTMNGGSGNDTLDGGNGDDLLTGSRGADSIDGGAGTDTASYGNSDAGVIVDLAAGTAVGSGHSTGDMLINIENVDGSQFGDDLAGDSMDNAIRGLAGDDTITGGDGNDTLNGAAGVDDLSGGLGDDLLVGGNANDTLMGGDGNDTLNGGAGDDQLTGGLGADSFYFGRPDFGSDTITDFVDGTDIMDFVDSGLAFADLTISFGAVNTVVSVTSDPTIQITLENITSGIDSNDFMF